MHAPSSSSTRRMVNYVQFKTTVETYYCLGQAVGDDLMFEVEVIDPKDNQRDVEQEER